jgi:hypothetical protein
MALGAASVVGGLTLGVVGMAAATSSPKTAGPAPAALAAVPAQASPSAPAPVPGAPVPPGFKGGPGMREKGGGPRGGGLRFGGGVLHGEFVTDKPGGGYQTVQIQNGVATAVSATSITVKSTDGFTRTYAVTKDTLVNAGRDGITTIAVNDKVDLKALGAGTSATVVDVADETKMLASRGKFAPDREKPTADASPSSSA